MHKILKIILILVLGLNIAQPMSGQQSASSGKRERGYIREGNKLYNDKRYSEAEVAYRKALQENEYSEVAMYNLASALIKQASLATGEEDGQNNPAVEAQKIFGNLATGASNDKLAENSLYNLGNIAFNQEQYDRSIDMYKRTLRKNPDNDKARENLRLAQLKLEEQQNQDQDQNQNQDQDQNKEQNQDQQNQDQNQDQNQQDQNQDQDNQDQNQNQSQSQNEDQNQDRQNEQNGISDRNAEQILKAMENEENATRRKIEAQRAKEEQKNASKKKKDKPW